MDKTLSLKMLERFDPRAARGQRERRFCCPLCNGTREKNASHRSLAVNTDSGLWRCHRCEESGILLEYRSSPRSRAALIKGTKARFGIRPTGRIMPAAPPTYNYRHEVSALVSLQGTRGAAYLLGRCVPREAADAAGVLFARRLLGVQAVVFPLVDETGARIGVQARACQAGSAWKRTIYDIDKSGGVFLAGQEPFALPVIVEAPIDALSLAVGGLPAIATVGTGRPNWLPGKCALKRVVLAHDADDAGNKAAESMATELRGFGAEVLRLRPPRGCKDWNEALVQLGPVRFREMMEVVRCRLNLAPPNHEQRKAPRPVQIGSHSYQRLPLCDKYRVCSEADRLKGFPAQRELFALLQAERLAARAGPGQLSDHLFHNAGRYEELRVTLEQQAKEVRP